MPRGAEHIAEALQKAIVDALGEAKDASSGETLLDAMLIGGVRTFLGPQAAFQVKRQSELLQKQGSLWQIMPQDSASEIRVLAHIESSS